MKSKDIVHISLKGDPEKIALKRVSLASGDLVDFPIYRYTLFPKFHCVGYVRRAANEFLGRKYVEPSPAWNLRHIYKTIPLTDLDFQESNREIVPGDLVGIFNNTSNYLEGLDMREEPRIYTHVALFLGRSYGGHLLLGEQRGSKRQIVTPREIKNMGNSFIEIIKDELL